MNKLIWELKSSLSQHSSGIFLPKNYENRTVFDQVRAWQRTGVIFLLKYSVQATARKLLYFKKLLTNICQIWHTA